MLPLTPFHLGPPFLIYGIFGGYVCSIPLIVAALLPDIESFLVISLGIHFYPLHGLLHTYIAGFVLGLIATHIFSPPRYRLRYLLSFMAGYYSHIFLDSLLYEDIKPWFPLPFKPFYGSVSPFHVYEFCFITLFVGGFLVGIRRLIRRDDD